MKTAPEREDFPGGTSGWHDQRPWLKFRSDEPGTCIALQLAARMLEHGLRSGPTARPCGLSWTRVLARSTGQADLQLVHYVYFTIAGFDSRVIKIPGSSGM